MAPPRLLSLLKIKYLEGFVSDKAAGMIDRVRKVGISRLQSHEVNEVFTPICPTHPFYFR